eukprot:TRINITY_DN9749_c0_g1_i7.p2 TRINITY_DN9749_c0_g1~~TRINITY_DN9749_c0_g1_i7.p2  ORF type:complete len:111 (-),score=22.54 TRINITY_DN9749_c0_g1_i7:125-457(-)
MAFRHYLRAARVGKFDMAQYNVARCYEQGIGIPPNLEKAVLWYSRSGRSGNQYAIERLQLLRRDIIQADADPNDDEEELRIEAELGQQNLSHHCHTPAGQCSSPTNNNQQ